MQVRQKETVPVKYGADFLSFLVHRLSSADHILVVDEGTVKEQGSYPELASRPGAVKELIALAGGTATAQSKGRATSTPAPDEVQSPHIASLDEDNEDIEAEMASVQAKRNSVLVYLFASGRVIMWCALALKILSSAMSSVIPVYIQAWTTALRTNPGSLFRYMGG